MRNQLIVEKLKMFSQMYEGDMEYTLDHAALIIIRQEKIIQNLLLEMKVIKKGTKDFSSFEIARNAILNNS